MTGLHGTASWCESHIEKVINKKVIEPVYQGMYMLATHLDFPGVLIITSMDPGG